MIDNRRMLWNDLSRLGGVETPRSWYSEGCGWPSRLRPRASFTLLGQEWQFRKPSFIGDVLERVRRELDLDSERWRTQRDFLVQFGCEAFRSTDGPAWIQVIGERKGFGGVMQAGSRHVHLAQLADDRVPLQDLRRSTIRIKGRSVPWWPTELIRDQGNRDRLFVQRVYVHRWIVEQGRRLRHMHERLIVTSDDPEDMRLVAKGITPAIEVHRDCEDINRSPLITFLRLGDRYRRVVGRIAGFDASGTLSDLRATDDPAEFFFKSNMHAHHVALERLLTEGEYEAY